MTSTITYLQGDATRPQLPTPTRRAIIAHVCNDLGGWGAGFVLALSARWPQPAADYAHWTRRGAEGGFALGNIRLIRVEPRIWVCNMIGQTTGWGKDGKTPPIRYDAIETCLRKLTVRARDRRADVHAPRFGSGLAGGDWAKIEPIIERTLGAAGVRTFIYDLPPGTPAPSPRRLPVAPKAPAPRPAGGGRVPYNIPGLVPFRPKAGDGRGFGLYGEFKIEDFRIG